MRQKMSIGDVAKRSGVAASALRFYEQRGLITADRASSGHRTFPRAVLRRIAFIVYDITVFFADIVGFTTLSEQFSASEITEFLNLIR